MKILSSFLPAVVFFAAASGAALASASTSDADLTANFNVSAPTNVPGKTLKSGSYSIRVIDHLSDRVLLQIEDSKGKSQTRFLAVPNTTLPHGTNNGPIAYAEAKHGPNSLRGFSFPGGSTVEFVYPKVEAAGIAQVNGASVLAIDPASEGRPAASKLSKDDMELVTLWTLSPTRVGPQDATVAAIQAQRYEPARPVSPPPTEVASLGTLPRIPSVQAPPLISEAGRTPARFVDTRPRAAKRTAAITSLPHTASGLPLTFLVSLLLLGSAAVLRLRRTQALGARA